MRKISKERWRAIHQIREPKDPADPEVVARRPVHESITQWELAWIPRLHLVSICIALLIIFAPSVSRTWRELITALPVIGWIHAGFTSFGLLMIGVVGFGFSLYVYSNRMLDGENFSEYGYPINMSEIRAARDVATGELYPRTNLEEKIFFVDFVGAVWMATAFWFVVFGIISIFIDQGVR